MWLGLRVGGCLALLYIHQMNLVNSLNDIGHDDNTIVVVIIIIIVIVILHDDRSTCVNNLPRVALDSGSEGFELATC